MAGEFNYQSGFGNQHSSEAIAGSLPEKQNSPKVAPLGLYAEQLSGSAFTAPRGENLRTWVYRIRPPACTSVARRILGHQIKSAPLRDNLTPPDPMRWDPLPIPETPTDFLSGLITWAANGHAEERRGSAIHLYAANSSMEGRYFYNADGELLIVPQQGDLEIFTELGKLAVTPGEIAVVPRGMRFRVSLFGPSRGYVCENYGLPFRLPGLGPIGANGLADPRHFKIPCAHFEDRTGNFEVVSKFLGELFTITTDRSPLDVVAWHGNYVPYKYDLDLFQVVGTVSFDHPDPSIFTVLTSPSEIPGTANVDFVIFPPRWMVAEHTFRPPYFHRNLMSEYMGLIRGHYDAKAEGFVPGGASLHNCMTGHGPDAETFEKASRASEDPHKLSATLAFMFESGQVYRVAESALTAKTFQKNYIDCWKGLKANFQGKREGK